MQGNVLCWRQVKNADFPVLGVSGTPTQCGQFPPLNYRIPMLEHQLNRLRNVENPKNILTKLDRLPSL